MKKRARRTTLIVVIVLAAIGFLFYQGLGRYTAYYLTVKEVVDRRQELEGRPIKVNAVVVGDTIQWEPQETLLKFELREEGSDLRLPVEYKGVKPDNFTDGKTVVVEGVLQDGVLIADSVLVQCPTKYEAAKE